MTPLARPTHKSWLCVDESLIRRVAVVADPGDGRSRAPRSAGSAGGEGAGRFGSFAAPFVCALTRSLPERFKRLQFPRHTLEIRQKREKTLLNTSRHFQKLPKASKNFRRSLGPGRRQGTAGR